MDLNVINNTVDLLQIENLTFEELVETFDAVVSIVFEDNIYNWGRFFVLEVFAKAFADRASQVNKDLLLSALKHRINSERDGLHDW
jgi:hypothetical protein